MADPEGLEKKKPKTLECSKGYLRSLIGFFGDRAALEIPRRLAAGISNSAGKDGRAERNQSRTERALADPSPGEVLGRHSRLLQSTERT